MPKRLYLLHDELNILIDSLNILRSQAGTSVSIIDIIDKISQKIEYFQEDLELTLNSFSEAKSPVKDKKILAKTLKYADECYRIRLYEISRMLLSCLWQLNLKQECATLGQMRPRLLNHIHYGFSENGPFQNPLPDHLFFSQYKHSHSFSEKAQRDGVSGKLITEVVDLLTSGEKDLDYLRVNMYFAPFHGKLEPFTYNNRTWAVYSKAHLLPNRIVPIMPTQDLLNRINEVTNPNVITDETTLNNRTPDETLSLRPGRFG